MKGSKKEDFFRFLIAFRRQLGTKASRRLVRNIWAVSNVAQIPLIDQVEETYYNELIESKLLLTEKSDPGLKLLKMFGLAKYVGFSGSLAAGTFKEGDDLDLFIVVRNHTAWIYRGLLKLMLYPVARNVESVELKDKLCTNFICEERALGFKPSIFVFHELFSLIGIINPEYLKTIIAKNSWVAQFSGVSIKKLDKNVLWGSVLSLLLMPVNFLFFVLQLAYMLIAGHSPKIDELIKNFFIGRIIFYPSDFRDKVELQYLKELEKQG